VSTALKRAIDTQNRTWAAMQEIQGRADKEDRALNAEERQAWDTAEAELNEASGDIERFERSARLDKVDRDQVVDAVTGDPRAAGDGEKRYADAFGRYMRRGLNGCNDEQRELLEGNFVESRDQGTGTDTAGGYLVPEGFRNKLVEVMKAYGGLLDLAEPLVTDTGNDLPWVTNDDTGNEGEIVGENQAVSQQDLAFGGRRLKAHNFSSRMMLVPLMLLQDSAFSLEEFIPRKAGERIGRRAARAWINGTGVDEPEGVTTNTLIGKTGLAGQVSSVIYDDLIDLEHSVDVAYRNERSRFLFHDLTLAALRKLKDGQQRPLWVPVPGPGFSATINGRAYTIDNSMPTMAANAKSILFGDFRSGYVVRQVRGVSTMRLAERYAEKLQVAFFSWARLDGAVQDANAYKAYQHPAS
jgi:HK97 family phage major capsid protein